jgi:peptidoglycan hydrolase-like protein with peptidoglycan-binding domain
MIRVFATFFLMLMIAVRTVSAQQSSEDAVWIQIEAHPSLRVAQERARIYSDALADVNGFSLGGSWYGIVLGPYARQDAERVLRVYRRERQIPRDSFVARSSALNQQFWPVGANVLNRGVVVASPLVPLETPAPTETVVAAPKPAADETPRQARQSERALNSEERKALQIALQASGFYNARIDGAFGPGTRRSMSEWQSFNGHEPTGILTTLQRRALMDAYNAPLISVGMARRYDDKAGIEMDMPLGAVRFATYEPPFAHYDSQDDIGARVLLISQPGTKATLFGLYEIMQTLEVVPLNGPRSRAKDSFTIEGRGNGIVSYTQAALKNGEIKGFTLIWPEGDEERRARVLTEMKSSFARTSGVLDPATGSDIEQQVDLISGLQVRKPRQSRSGFYVDGKGTVVTVSEAVKGCSRVTLDHDYQAEIVSSDDALGVAILRPKVALAPLAVANFRAGSPRLNSGVTVSGFSYEGLLGASTLTRGTLADVRGLRGETELIRLAMTPQDGDAGGPVMDAGGTVIGMLLPDLQTGQKLPKDVSFAADARALQDVLDAAGLRTSAVSEAASISPDELGRRANDMTVLVSCWD